MTKTLLAACPILRPEIEKYLETHDCGFDLCYLPCDLHNSPDKLRAYLQECLDRKTGYDRILLPAGRCGNGTIGLKAGKAELVLPKTSDCIDLLLSGGTLPVKREIDSMFLTGGWLDEETGRTMMDEYRRLVEKYDEDQAEMIMQMMYEHYHHLTLLDTGAYDLDEAERRITPVAEVCELTVNRKDAPCALLYSLLEQETENPAFAVVAPGETVTEETFGL